MKVSVSPCHISRRMAKSIGILFILGLVVLAYAFTALTAYADSPPAQGINGYPIPICEVGQHIVTDNNGQPYCVPDK